MSKRFSFSRKLKPSPKVRPLLNIGCLLDISTGKYYFGKHGESILNGGLAPLTGIGGRGNTYKSTIAHHMSLTVLNRYPSASWNMYDTEMSFTSNRAHDLARHKQNIVGVDLEEEDRMLITDSTIYSGNKWFDEIKDFCDEKVDCKDATRTLPIVNKEGTHYHTLEPSIASADSFSRMNVDAVDAILEKNSAGDSGNNMSATKDAGSKHQMLIQMPALTSRSALYMILTAHVDDDLQLDPYAPNQKKLSFLKNKLKFKYVSNQYHFLMNNLWYCFDAAPLKNQTTKAAEYPRDKEDNKNVHSKDLMVVTMQNLRGKYGASGAPLEFVVSQTEGVLVGLTEFHHLKNRGRFGLGGSVQNYYVELCPDISLQRTTVRSKINEHPELERALEICSEMEQLFSLQGHDMNQNLIMEPKALYENLKERGYCWDTLLTKTRGYYAFEEDLPLIDKYFLSTMDLLRMAAGFYHPYWYDEYAKANNLPEPVKGERLNYDVPHLTAA